MPEGMLLFRYAVSAGFKQVGAEDAGSTEAFRDGVRVELLLVNFSG